MNVCVTNFIQQSIWKQWYSSWSVYNKMGLGLMLSLLWRKKNQRKSHDVII